MYNDIVTKESEGSRVGRVFLWVECFYGQTELTDWVD